MDTRVRRALMRLTGAGVVVLGLFVSATAVRRADQVVASGREVLLGGELVDLLAAGDLAFSNHAELAATTVALGQLDVGSGSLRVEREASRVFAVGGGITVARSAAVIFPEAGTLKYGTIRSGAAGSAETVLRDPGAVAGYAAMVPSLRRTSECFERTGSSGFVSVTDGAVTLVGDGASGLQVFNVAERFAGRIAVSRVPVGASIVVNVLGADVDISPTGAEWREISAHTVVNVPAAQRVDVDTRDGLGMHLLVGDTDSTVGVVGDRYEGSLLALGSVSVDGSRIEHAPLLAPLVPECAHRPTAAVPEPTTPARDRLVDDDAEDTKMSTTTSTSTSTTTTTVSGNDPAGAAPVPGVAFALGGAATSSQWWIGIPLTIIGLVMLSSSLSGRGRRSLPRVVRVSRRARSVRR